MKRGMTMVAVAAVLAAASVVPNPAHTMAAEESAALAAGPITFLRPEQSFGASTDGRFVLTLDGAVSAIFDRSTGIVATPPPFWSAMPTMLPDGSGFIGLKAPSDPDGTPDELWKWDRVTGEFSLAMKLSDHPSWAGRQVHWEIDDVSNDGNVVALRGYDQWTLEAALVTVNVVSGAVVDVLAGFAPKVHMGAAVDATLSADGNRVAFTYGLGPIGCAAECFRVWVYDLLDGSYTLVDRTTSTSSGAVAWQSVISADGSAVVFRSNQPLLDADVPPTSGFGLYVRDLGSGAITRVSANGTHPQISGNGQRVTFLTDDDAEPQLWAVDLGFGHGAPRSQLISEGPSGPGDHGISDNWAHALTEDGTESIFTSFSTNLTADQPSTGGSFTRALSDDSFMSVTPQRLLDTRNGAPTIDGENAGGGRLAVDSVTRLQVTGRAGIPSGASAAVLNLTVAEPTATGYVTAWPCGPRPTASNLNFVAGQTVANLAIVTLDADGGVCLQNAESSAHLIVDVSGHYPAASSYTALAPARVLDTRAGGMTADGAAQASGRAPAGQVIDLQIAGRAGIPSHATSAVVNVTVADPTAGGYVSAWPCGEPPNASIGNFAAGQTVANMAVIALDDRGHVCLTVSETDAHVIADVSGYFTGAYEYVPVVPQRFADTRAGGATVDGVAQQGGAVSAGSTLEVAIAGRGSVPASAAEASLTVTATGGDDVGYLTVWDCGSAAPTASVLNYRSGQNVANTVITPLSATGTVCVRAGDALTHVLIDAVGYTR